LTDKEAIKEGVKEAFLELFEKEENSMLGWFDHAIQNGIYGAFEEKVSPQIIGSSISDGIKKSFPEVDEEGVRFAVEQGIKKAFEFYLQHLNEERILQAIEEGTYRAISEKK